MDSQLTKPRPFQSNPEGRVISDSRDIDMLFCLIRKSAVEYQNQTSARDPRKEKDQQQQTTME
jgi:hypothetical protein